MQRIAAASALTVDVDEDQQRFGSDGERGARLNRSACDSPEKGESAGRGDEPRTGAKCPLGKGELSEGAGCSQHEALIGRVGDVRRTVKP